MPSYYFLFLAFLHVVISSFFYFHLFSGFFWWFVNGFIFCIYLFRIIFFVMWFYFSGLYCNFIHFLHFFSLSWFVNEMSLFIIIFGSHLFCIYSSCILNVVLFCFSSQHLKYSAFTLLVHSLQVVNTHPLYFVTSFALLIILLVCVFQVHYFTASFCFFLTFRRHDFRQFKRLR